MISVYRTRTKLLVPTSCRDGFSETIVSLSRHSGNAAIKVLAFVSMLRAARTVRAEL